MVKASCRNQRKQSTCFLFFSLTRLWIYHMIIFFNLTHSLRIFTVHTGTLETHCLSSPSRSRQLLEVRVWVRRWVQCEERPNKEGKEMLKGTKWRHKRAEWTFSCFLAVNSPSLARQWRFSRAPVLLRFWRGVRLLQPCRNLICSAPADKLKATVCLPGEHWH